MLGVSPGASYDELKRAYASKAFRLHPDRQGDVDPDELERADWRMKELNASWAVLRDTARRKEYDDELAARDRPRVPASTPPRGVDDLPDLEPDEGGDDTDDLHLTPLQYRVLRYAPLGILFVVLIFILIVTAYATRDSEQERRLVTTEQAPVGSCVRIDPSPDPSVPASLDEVPCGTPQSQRVVAKVPDPVDCPVGSAAKPIRGERLTICIQ